MSAPYPLGRRVAHDRFSAESGSANLQEAAAILGHSVEAVQRHVAAGRLVAEGSDGTLLLNRPEVERLASEVFAWRRHADDDEPYWVTGQRAADLLGVSRSRLGQLADAGQVPHMRHQDGTRLYRRHELVWLSQLRRTETAIDDLA